MHLQDFVKAMMFGALLLIGAGSSNVHAATVEEQATATIRLLTKSQGPGSCSMVVTAPGHGVTAAHCAEMDRATQAGAQVPVTIRPVPGRDFATVEGTALDCPCAPTATPEIGERVIAAGFAHGVVMFVSEGRYQGVDPRDGQLVISAPLIPGMSGGGTFVIRAGIPRLVGVNVALMGNMNFAERL